MKLIQDDLLFLTETAIKAAKAAGLMIAQNSVRKDISVSMKSTTESLASQVVTEVDAMSQEIILKHLHLSCKKYDLGLLAEESEDDNSRQLKDYFWCIDPMDGTLPFIEARPGYAVSIGLVSRKGEPIIGVVYDPLEKILYHAFKNNGAFRNGKKWCLNPTTSNKFEVIDRGGVVMTVCWVLESGAACFYKHPKSQQGGGCVWDYAATACIYREIGAWVSDIYGDQLELNRQESHFMNHKGVLFASNAKIARKIMDEYVRGK